MIPEYRAAPELVRMHEQFRVEMEKQKRVATTSKNLRGTDVMKCLLPLIEATMGFTAGVQGDLAGYIEQLSALDEDAMLGGIDLDTANDIDSHLKELLALVTKMGSAANNGAKEDAEHAVKLIAELREVVQELVVSEVEEGEEPLEESEFDGEDAPLEIEE